jgi:hypothetical protein
VADTHANENGALTTTWTFKQLQRAAPSLVKMTMSAAGAGRLD